MEHLRHCLFESIFDADDGADDEIMIQALGKALKISPEHINIDHDHGTLTLRGDIYVELTRRDINNICKYCSDDIHTLEFYSSDVQLLGVQLGAKINRIISNPAMSMYDCDTNGHLAIYGLEGITTDIKGRPDLELHCDIISFRTKSPSKPVLDLTNTSIHDATH